MRTHGFVKIAAALSALAMISAVSACGDNEPLAEFQSSTSSKNTSISGEFTGAGASSQQAAVEAWISGFQTQYPNVRIAYNPTGSGAGVSTFLTGATAWAASDAALTQEQVNESKSVCADGTSAFDIPVYVSPIAVVFNLQGISGRGETLNLDAATLAKIFNGTITNWNDPAIAKQNPDVFLPDLAITVVHRSDKSGTTKDFLNYIDEASDGVWKDGTSQNWPNHVGQGAKGTSGVISTISQANGTIGYADASQVGDLGTVALKVGSSYVPFSADAAAKAVDASNVTDTDNRIVIDLDYKTTQADTYPLVLVSYNVACPVYTNSNTTTFVKDWFTYVVSKSGQAVAAKASGSAPISDSLRTMIMKSINAMGTSSSSSDSASASSSASSSTSSSESSSSQK